MITVRSASRPPVRGSASSRQLGDDVGHLVAAFAAADVDDHVGVAPLGDLLQQHGLARAETRRAPPRCCRARRETAGRAPAGRCAAAVTCRLPTPVGPWHVGPANSPTWTPVSRRLWPARRRPGSHPQRDPLDPAFHTRRHEHAVFDGIRRRATRPEQPRPTPSHRLRLWAGNASRALSRCA